MKFAASPGEPARQISVLRDVGIRVDRAHLVESGADNHTRGVAAAGRGALPTGTRTHKDSHAGRTSDSRRTTRARPGGLRRGEMPAMPAEKVVVSDRAAMEVAVTRPRGASATRAGVVAAATHGTRPPPQRGW